MPHPILGDIYKLRVDQLIPALSARGLSIVGDRNKLRRRLYIYEHPHAKARKSDKTVAKSNRRSKMSTHSDDDENSGAKNKSKLPFFKPAPYSGQTGEEITHFFKNYNLAHFSDDLETFLTTDCSGKAMGFMLEQKDLNGELHPIAFGSKVLTDPQTRYSALELELLAVVTGVETFRDYLYFRQFTVYSDHKALESFRHLKSPSHRIAKFIAKLLPYDFSIIYKPGKQNLVADHLSREIFLIQPNLDEDLQTLPNLLDAQDNDEFCSNIKKALRNEPVSPEISKKSRCYCLGPNNILYFKKISK